MKTIVLLLALVFGLNSGYCNFKNLDLSPKQTITLKMVGEDGENSGGVAYNPNFKLYYVAMSGNIDFPLEVFSEDGKAYYQTVTEFDLRGIWYNTEFNTVEGNVYEYHDIVEYLINDDDGTPYDPAQVIWELPVYDAQAALSYNSKDTVYVLYNYEEGIISEFETQNGDHLRDITLELPVNSEDINSTSVVYTGIDEAEYGLYNFKTKEVYLINKENGKVATTVKLPKDAPERDFLNFSFSNGHVWLFDSGTKTWIGYKVVKS